MRETSVQFLGWEDSLEKGIEIHSSILAWRNPMDRGAWQAAVHGITKSQMWLGNEAQTIYEGNPLTSICQMGREMLELSPGLVAPESTIFVCAPAPHLAFLVAQTVKSPPVMRKIQVRSLGWEDPLEKGMATHCSILAWGILMDRSVWWTTAHAVVKIQNWVTHT